MLDYVKSNGEQERLVEFVADHSSFSAKIKVYVKSDGEQTNVQSSQASDGEQEGRTVNKQTTGRFIVNQPVCFQVASRGVVQVVKLCKGLGHPPQAKQKQPQAPVPQASKHQFQSSQASSNSNRCSLTPKVSPLTPFPPVNRW